jgi:hypothetical protein
MEWAFISGMADLVAAFGVIGSLIFVGFQMRQSNVGLRLASVQSQTTMFQGIVSQLANTADMAEVVWQGYQDIDKLEGASRLRFDVAVNSVFRAGQSIHCEWQHGVYDDELFAGIAIGMENFATRPGARVVWKDRHDQCTPEFQKFVEECFAKGNQRI